jgi:hypothetical protein
MTTPRDFPIYLVDIHLLLLHGQSTSQSPFRHSPIFP